MPTRYIDASMLQIGDILLSQSTDKISSFIAKSTNGQYSHAAIYVRDYQVFEARTDGVGFSALKPVRAELGAGKTPRILCSMDGYKHISLFRCPSGLRTHPGTDDIYLMSAMYPMLFGLNGVEYKKLEGFKKLRTRFNWIPISVRSKMLKAAGNTFLGDKKKLITEEFFCSELVVYVLTKLGLPVLKNQAQCPDEISPNDLARPTVSNLVEIPNLVRFANPSANSVPEHFLLTAKMLAYPISNKKVVKMTRELNKLNEQILANMRQSIGNRRKRDD